MRNVRPATIRRSGKDGASFTPTEKRKKDRLMRQFLKGSQDGPRGASPEYCSGYDRMLCVSCETRWRQSQESALCAECFAKSPRGRTSSGQREVPVKKAGCQPPAKPPPSDNLDGQ